MGALSEAHIWRRAVQPKVRMYTCFAAKSPDMQKKKILEEHLEHAKINLKDRQSELKEVNSQIHELEFFLSDLVECEEQVRMQWKDRDVAARALDKELQEQQSKLVRAEKLLQKLKREARQLKEHRVPLHLAEKDIDLRELQDINQSAMQQLAELSTRYSEVGPLLNKYLGEKGLSLPVVKTGTINDHQKVSCGSILSTQRSITSEKSHISWGSGPSSQAPSIILMDPNTIQPASKGSGDSKHSRISVSRKKNK